MNSSSLQLLRTNSSQLSVEMCSHKKEFVLIVHEPVIIRWDKKHIAFSHAIELYRLITVEEYTGLYRLMLNEGNHLLLLEKICREVSNMPRT